MNKKTIFAIILIIVLAGVLFWASKNKQPAPVADPNSLSAIDSQTSSDTTAEMQNDLNSIDSSAGIESDLNEIDAKIQTL